jgi:DNA-binding MarR family transcriptional regulator
MSATTGPVTAGELDRDSLERIEHEITVLIRRTLEPVWSGGYGTHEAVDRYTYPVLAALEEHGGQSLTALTGRLGVSKPTASRQVSRLSRAGLVEVRPDPRDSRSVVVSLTAEGLAQRDLVRRARLGPLHAVLEGWPGADREALGALLARFNSDLDEYRERGR